MNLYLVSSHTYYLLRNITTWEFIKRDQVPYLRRIDLYPFDKGCIANICQLFTTNEERPIDWGEEL